MRGTKRIMIGVGFACTALAVNASAFQAGEPRKPRVPVLSVETYKLANGLTIILHEDHKTPVASLNLWYKVGSKDEQPSRTGFAHLFEHMMFLGSKNHDEDFSHPLEKLGADNNATTDTDRTDYYETVPSHALELALWLEADRMGFLLPAMTQQKLDTERDVVKNERRQSVDNVPYGQAEQAMLEALYPPGHPYHHSVIGSMADLSAARLADVESFFRTHYVPNNAILCVAGDFDRAQTKKWIDKYFGPIPAGRPIAAKAPSVPVIAESKHIRLTDAVSLPRAQLLWPTVQATHPDEPALDVLASVLGGLAKENRLFRALLYDRQIAAQVGAGHPTQALSGTFEVELYARPGQNIDELVTIADAEIKRLIDDGPTPLEVYKAQNERESALIMGLQSVTHKATVLNQYMDTYGDPLGYRTEVERIFAVTPGDVKRVARKYLVKPRVRLDVVPGDSASRPPEAVVDRSKQEPLSSPPLAAIKDDFDRSVTPSLGPTPRYVPPRFVRRRLASGLELRIVERHELPIVTVDLVIKSGETLTPPGKEGLCSITASLLEEGTKTRTGLQIAGELAEIGATMGAAGELESTTISVTTLTRHLDRALDLYADVLLNPSFPEKELSRLKLERLAQLKARTDDAEQTAGAVFPRLLFGPEYPYGRPDIGTALSVSSITRDDAVTFFNRIMVPANAAVVVVGDVDPDEITAAMERRLGTWKNGPAPDPPALLPAPVAGKGGTLYLIDKPAAAQSVLAVGKIGADRKSPDYHALVVMNAILGGQFASRLNLNLREEKGYSYGAQSSFAFLKAPGPFEAGGTVQTAVTAEAMAEIWKELTDISGPRPVTAAELAFAKERIILGFPHRFETTFGVASQVAHLIEDDLSDDEFLQYQSRIEAVTKADVDRVARAYIIPSQMTFLVVGDRALIEKPLKNLPFVRVIEPIDSEGKPLAAPAGAAKSAAVPVSD